MSCLKSKLKKTPLKFERMAKNSFLITAYSTIYEDVLSPMYLHRQFRSI